MEHLVAFQCWGRGTEKPLRHATIRKFAWSPRDSGGGSQGRRSGPPRRKKSPSSLTANSLLAFSSVGAWGASQGDIIDPHLDGALLLLVHHTP